MKILLIGLLALGSISAFAGISDDIINASLRCKQLGMKVEDCIPKEVSQSSSEAALTYNILTSCEQFSAPLLECFQIYETSMRVQGLGLNVNENLPHFESQILEAIRNSLSRQDAVGVNIKKELLSSTHKPKSPARKAGTW